MEWAPGSFLFSLDGKTKHEIYDNQWEALGGSFNDGPCFGTDLVLKDNCNVNSSSFSNLGSTYALPEGTTYRSARARSHLAGTNKFQVEEYEVFKVI